MNLDLFRADLADLAEDVTQVDVRDRALATSRRIGRRRAIGGVVAAAAFVAVAGGVAVAAVPDRDAAPILPPSNSTPRPTAPSTPGPTTAPSTPASPDATESALTQPPVSTALGTIFYGPAPGSDGDKTRLFSWTGSGAPQRGAEIPRLAAVANTTVSPDGRRVAWVDDDAALFVANVDGTGKRKLLDSVDGQCWGPVWAGDSQSLGVAVIDRTGGDYKDTKGVYDFTQERFYEVRQVSGCHPVWSARGDTIVYADGSDGRIMITGGTLRTPSAIKGIGGPGRPYSFDLASISPDGTKVALLLRQPGQDSGDVARELRVNAVVRTSDGQPIDLPLDGREMAQAFFQPDGTLVVRVEDGDGYTLVLISEDGEKVTEVAEPAALRDMQIVSVAG
jgi:TolB protein